MRIAVCLKRQPHLLDSVCKFFLSFTGQRFHFHCKVRTLCDAGPQRGYFQIRAVARWCSTSQSFSCASVAGFRGCMASKLSWGACPFTQRTRGLSALSSWESLPHCLASWVFLPWFFCPEKWLCLRLLAFCLVTATVTRIPFKAKYPEKREEKGNVDFP